MRPARLLSIALMMAALAVLQGCAFAVGAAAGATAGYILKDKGYTVQSPIQKTQKQETSQ